MIPTEPVHIIVDRPRKPKGVNGIVSIAISFAPVIIILLMHKPALRQAIKLRVAQSAFRFCDFQVESWKKAMMTTGKIYRNTQL